MLVLRHIGIEGNGRAGYLPTIRRAPANLPARGRHERRAGGEPGAGGAAAAGSGPGRVCYRPVPGVSGPAGGPGPAVMGADPAAGWVLRGSRTRPVGRSP